MYALGFGRALVLLEGMNRVVVAILFPCSLRVVGFGIGKLYNNKLCRMANVYFIVVQK